LHCICTTDQEEHALRNIYTAHGTENERNTVEEVVCRNKKKQY